MDLSLYDNPEDAVGVAFRLTRRRLRLSQRELAELLGWDPAKVGRWEAGRVSPALGRIDGVLRGMGFRLAVVIGDPQEWTGVDPPVEHIADRAFRHFPAHLDARVVADPPLHWWLRFRDAPNPMAPNWTYRRRTWWTEFWAEADRRAAGAEAAEGASASSGQAAEKAAPDAAHDLGAGPGDPVEQVTGAELDTALTRDAEHGPGARPTRRRAPDSPAAPDGDADGDADVAARATPTAAPDDDADWGATG